MTANHPYDQLTPEAILTAVETCGVRCTGALLALNSYENRVYRLELEDAPPVVAKFYRPARWSDAAILEEHAFATELHEHEIPAVAPRACTPGSTLAVHAGFRFTLFPWQPGRATELNNSDDYRVLGRFLGRLHRLGSAQSFAHRLRFSVEEFGHTPVHILKTSAMIPDDLRLSYVAITDYLLPRLEDAFAAAASVRWLRLHGDCHLGNILWGREGPYFVDFDDCMMGPAVQDLWMLLAGERADREQQVSALLSGYTEFMDFDPRELALIESLRTLRLLHYSAWLTRRWDDPAFPRAFPWFNTQRYWEDQILTLKEQAAILDEPPLSWRD
ncbi:MAG: serine/threonine protein kinase [Pseudomonadota bacterium]|nr:MAG: serine/threonine protein kinase [Pseudomonadota bacterium]